MAQFGLARSVGFVAAATLLLSVALPGDATAGKRSTPFSSAPVNNVVDLPPNCPMSCVLRIAGKAASSNVSVVGKQATSVPRYLKERWPLLDQMLANLLNGQSGACEQVELALSTTLQYGISQYGVSQTRDMTAALIVEAEHAGISPYIVGSALARAASALKATNRVAADAIAATVANEGLPCERYGFDQNSKSLGVPEIAKVTEVTPEVTPEPTGGTESGGGGGGGGPHDGGFIFVPGGGGGGPGCLTASCTSY